VRPRGLPSRFRRDPWARRRACILGSKPTSTSPCGPADVQPPRSAPRGRPGTRRGRCDQCGTSPDPAGNTGPWRAADRCRCWAILLSSFKALSPASCAHDDTVGRGVPWQRKEGTATEWADLVAAEAVAGGAERRDGPVLHLAARVGQPGPKMAQPRRRGGPQMDRHATHGRVCDQGECTDRNVAAVAWHQVVQPCVRRCLSIIRRKGLNPRHAYCRVTKRAERCERVLSGSSGSGRASSSLSTSCTWRVSSRAQSRTASEARRDSVTWARRTAAG
jgi:hypothetical protein